MTETLISLISILTGIIAANTFGYIKKSYTFGFTGNTLIGVFGSILVLKSFGRLGFNPWSIMKDGSIDVSLFVINILVSALGGIIGLLLTKMIYRKMNT